jgi:Fe2+ transport system protein FeoA
LALDLLARAPDSANALPLSEAPEGAQVKVLSLDCAEKSRPLRLQAYGLAPGRTVRVLQQEPVTVVQAELTELALEDELASQVRVEVISPSSRA